MSSSAASCGSISEVGVCEGRKRSGGLFYQSATGHLVLSVSVCYSVKGGWGGPLSLQSNDRATNLLFVGYDDRGGGANALFVWYSGGGGID